MENSKKLSPSNSLENQLKVLLVEVFTQKKCANPKITLAFSGGLDSTVLLHLLAQCRKTLPLQLSAHHVHHGLSQHADEWADFCEEVCINLNVPFTLSKIKVNKNSGLGLEATAREARYNALLSADAQLICLAHHQDDQAETLLLQLARGAGVKGLAGMGTIYGKLLRPLLTVPRSHLASYAKQRDLTWIEDESNADTQLNRNFVRHKILPVLEESYPSIRQTLGRSAQHLATANDLLDELAQMDAIEAGFDANKTSTINLTTLKNLSEARINNCLRWWLSQNSLQMPSQQQLQQITQQLMHAKSDARIKLKVSAELSLRRYQNRAYLVQDLPSTPPINMLWQGEDIIDLPNKTQLIFSKKMGEGISLRKIENATLFIKFRDGNERFLPQLGRPKRSLKVILQNHAMPPWQREQLPLIFLDKTLVIIPNIGVDASLQANKDEMGLKVSWQ